MMIFSIVAQVICSIMLLLGALVLGSVLMYILIDLIKLIRSDLKK